MYSHLFISETEYIPMVINCMGKHLVITRCFLYAQNKIKRANAFTPALLSYTYLSCEHSGSLVLF
nr:MAG TPA: hypothetical protein [Caudoviricetes sp.]